MQAGRAGLLDAQSLLIALADDHEQPSIARATAAGMLGSYLGPTTIQTLAVLLRDADPLVRVNAISPGASCLPSALAADMATSL